MYSAGGSRSEVHSWISSLERRSTPTKLLMSKAACFFKSKAACFFISAPNPNPNPNSPKIGGLPSSGSSASLFRARSVRCEDVELEGAALEPAQTKQVSKETCYRGKRDQLYADF